MMTSSKRNIEQLHEAGAINKHELSEGNLKAINGMSQQEIGHLKASNKSAKKVSATAGVGL